MYFANWRPTRSMPLMKDCKTIWSMTSFTFFTQVTQVTWKTTLINAGFAIPSGFGLAVQGVFIKIA